MTLQIRNRRARTLAQKLAAQRNITMTEAVIQALESELCREADQKLVSHRIAEIAADLKA